MIRERESSLAPNLLQQAMLGNQSAQQIPPLQQTQSSIRSYQQPAFIQRSHSNNFSASSGMRNELKQQIESLNRQAYEASKRQESLKAVETNLLEKLDRKELENLELKEGLFELKQEN